MCDKQLVDITLEHHAETSGKVIALSQIAQALALTLMHVLPETRSTITEIIKMDFDTFLDNSEANAELVQGCKETFLEFLEAVDGTR